MIPLRLDGKSDEAQLVELQNYLRKKHKIGGDRIKKDWFLTCDSEYVRIRAWPHLSRCDLIKNAAIIRHPDIIIMDYIHMAQPCLIIEMDGSVHHTPAGRRKTESRNSDYHYMGIPLIVLDLPDLAEMDLTWQAFLDHQMEKKFDPCPHKNPTKQLSS